MKSSYWVCGGGGWNCPQWDDVNGCWVDECPDSCGFDPDEGTYFEDEEMGDELDYYERHVTIDDNVARKMIRDGICRVNDFKFPVPPRQMNLDDF